MNLDAANLQTHLPYYLTAEDQKILVGELNAIAGGAAAEYVLSSDQDDFKSQMLQGDGWRGFQLFTFESGERRSVRGMVLSNSCDISPENPRDLAPRVIFAPLVKLAAYRALLVTAGISIERVDAKIASIKAQKTTNLFYLPAGGSLGEDYIVSFDQLQSMPISVHSASEEKEKLFTLSNTGFYMLAFKLSVHFCRLQEKVNRRAAAAA